MEVIDRYELLEELGAGGFGRVYRARHQVLQREVALKVLLARRERDRFLREAAILAQLDHPNIVKVFDSGTTPEGHAFLALELLEGETTAQRLQSSGAQPLGEATWILDQLLEGLAAAHEQGVIHRDLKHPNVFLAQGSTGVSVKILDFGIAKLATAGRLTATGMLLGTPRYIAPEVFRGAEADVRSDLWAAGLMLYELLLGQRAYGGTAEEAAAAIAQGPPAPLESRLPGLPPLLYEVVDTALAYDPSGRFATARAFRAALMSAASPRPVHRTTQQVFATGTLDDEDAPFSAPVDALAQTPEVAPKEPTASTRLGKRTPPAATVPAATVAASPRALGGAPVAPSAPRRRWVVAALAIVALLAGGGVVLATLGADAEPVAARVPAPQGVPAPPLVEMPVPEPKPELAAEAKPPTAAPRLAEADGPAEAAAPDPTVADPEPAPPEASARRAARPSGESPPAGAQEADAPEVIWDQPSTEVLAMFARDEIVLRVRSCAPVEGHFSRSYLRRFQRNLSRREIRCPEGEYTVIVEFEDGHPQEVRDERGRRARSCLRGEVLSAARRFGFENAHVRCELY